MDRIVVEVDDIAAKKWRYATQEKRNQLTVTFNQLLQKALDKPEADFWSFLDKVSDNAKANGLTENDLNNLLNE